MTPVATKCDFGYAMLWHLQQISNSAPVINDVLKHTHISREHRTVCDKTVLLGEGFFSNVGYVDFNRFSFDDLLFKESSVRKFLIWLLFQNTLLFYCTLYTDSADGTDATARNLSFAQINYAMCRQG